MDTWRARVLGEGVLFPNSVHSDSLCEPSRGTLHTGQYPSNHGITDQNHVASLDWTKTFAAMLANATRAQWNAFIGKLCNNNWFANVPAPYQNGKGTIPPGWNRFIATDPAPGVEPQPFSYTIYENGSPISFGAAEPTSTTFAGATDFAQLTIAAGQGIGSRTAAVVGGGEAANLIASDTDFKQDVLAKKALALLAECIEKAKNGQPFFLMICPNAPHQGSGQAWRYTGTHSTKAVEIANWTPPNSGNFHQAGNRPPSDVAAAVGTGNADDQLTKRRQQAQEMAVWDDFWRAAFAMLDAAGMTDDTLIATLGDNGIAAGGKWVGSGKQDRYPESRLAGLAMRGRGFGRGAVPKYAHGVSSQVVWTGDIVPTFFDLFNQSGAGITCTLAGGKQFDGQSLLDPALATNRGVRMWDSKGGVNNNGFHGICTATDMWVEHFDPTQPQHEFYKEDAEPDTYSSMSAKVVSGVTLPAVTITTPQDLNNLVDPDTHAIAVSDPGGTLAARLTALKAAEATLATCTGASCRVTV